MADLNEIRDRMKKRKEMRSAFSSSSYQEETLKDDSHTLNEAESHYHLAKCYGNGLDGYAEDEEKEYQEYQLAADLGHTAAMVELASDYADEDYSILGYDLDKAEMWARRAIKGGDPDGYLVLYNVYVAKEQYPWAVNFLETGVEKGSLNCIEQKAYMLFWGIDEYGESVDSDEDGAFALVKDIEWGDQHIYAIDILAHWYENNGEPQLAKECYERLIEIDEEDYDSIYALGSLLSSNEEVLDYQRAKELLKIAAENGYTEAQEQYDMINPPEKKGIELDMDIYSITGNMPDVTGIYEL